ncbi:MAG TPA: response regulator [Anaerolineales bacterium]|nr:response regulator [Anaerolineales bacterium]
MPLAWIVDDDEEMCEAITLMLDLLGFRAVSYHSARRAAEALMAGQRPAVIILDIMMPEVSGIDLLEFLRARHELRDVPVVMLSSETTDVQVDEAMALGADAFAFKPVTIDELEVALRKALKSH